jgi:hypothetical protein
MPPLVIRCPRCDAVMPAGNYACIGCGNALRDTAANVARATRCIEAIAATPGQLSEGDANSLYSLADALVAIIKRIKAEGTARFQMPPGTIGKGASPLQKREAAREFLGRFGRWAKE